MRQRNIWLQAALHGFEFPPTDAAEFAQGVVPFDGPGLNLLRRKVRRRISSKDGACDSFCAFHYTGWGTQTNATDKSVNWYEPAGVFECVPRRVSHGACALTDEVGIQLLTVRNPLSQEIPPVVMPLCEPCT